MRAPGISTDWARATRGGPGVELLEAAFEHHVYDRHSHETLAIGITLRGVQRFWCRGSTHDSRPGDVIVLDPGDVHDGRSGAHGGYAYRMLYVDAAAAREIVEDASGRPAGDLTTNAPLIHDAVLAGEVNATWRARADSPDSLEGDERLQRIIRRLVMHGVQRRAIGPHRSWMHSGACASTCTIALASQSRRPPSRGWRG